MLRGASPARKPRRAEAAAAGASSRQSSLPPSASAARDARKDGAGSSAIQLLDLVNKMRRAVIRNGAHADDAEDIVQEAFARLEAYRRSSTVLNEEAFLMRTALNIGRDQARRRRVAPFVHRELGLDRILDASPPTDEVVRARQRLRHASAGLRQLDEQTRRWLLAQRLDGLTCARIARAEGLPLTTVEKRVARAALFLARWMEGW